MVSPRDGISRKTQSLPEDEVETVRSLFRKLQIQRTDRTRQSLNAEERNWNAEERDLALCAVTAAWEEISRYLPGYFEPGKELAPRRRSRSLHARREWKR